MDYGDAFPVYFDYNEMYDGFSSSFPSKDYEQVSEQDYQTNYNSGGEVGRELGDKSASELIDMNKGIYIKTGFYLSSRKSWINTSTYSSSTILSYFASM